MAKKPPVRRWPMPRQKGRKGRFKTKAERGKSELFFTRSPDPVSRGY